MQVIETVTSGIVTKLLVSLGDGLATEVSLIERPEKNIICFSTMVGCPVGCKFCVSGVEVKYVRKLTAPEMVKLVVLARNHATRKFWPYVISAMGEGEPAANIDAVIETFQWVRWNEQVKLALSTSAPTYKMLHKTLDALADYGERVKYHPKLQYSLHSVLSVERDQMFNEHHLLPNFVLPIIAESKYPNVELNICLIAGWNDNADSYATTTNLLSNTGRWNVKLNRFNASSLHGLQSASRQSYEQLQQALAEAGHSVEYYETDGSDIEAACGQLHFRYTVEEARERAT